MADWKAKPAPGSEYDVFLNFRGVETRHNFTDFLYKHLIDAGVRAFRDEEEVPHGDVISDKLEHAINNSILYIPIFSLNYASSKWCLRELKLMVDNVSASRSTKSMLPIFLYVEPDDVKLKARPDRDALYKAAFEEHEKNYREEAEAWKTALGNVDEHKGWVVEKKTSQAEIVKSVVERVLKKLGKKQILATEPIIGVDDRVKDLIRLLDVNPHDVQFIVIHGMGGIGKTTFAKEVFNQLISHFGKHCSFLYDVQKRSSTNRGTVELQKKLLSDILESKSPFDDTNDGLRRIEEELPTKKVLVVLDDAEEKEQVDRLIGHSKLHSGSCIIITSRKKDVLKDGDFEGKLLPYEMRQMDDDDAFQLFCLHAFRGEFRSNIHYQCSREIVSSLGGHPLAIKVTGRSLMGKDDALWKETLKKLRESSPPDIRKTLMISYDALDTNEKRYFLDIACFLVNEKKTDVVYIWNGPSDTPERGIEDLINRCLIKILDKDILWMHDLLIDLGRYIVREESQGDLRKQSRLWNAKEALQIISTKETNDNAQALLIDRMDDSIMIRNEELERLQNLRFLKLCNGTFVGDFEHCCSKLKWISWHPRKQDFCANNMHLDHLVVLKLDGNVFKDDSKAWDLIKEAQDLKVLSISNDFGITTIPDISKYSSLERLTLENCRSLKRIESFSGILRSLIELRIEKCRNLTDLPKEIGALVELKHFSLSTCPELTRLPGSIVNLTKLTELNISDTSIMKLPNSIEKLESLRILHFRRTSRILHYRRGQEIFLKPHNWQFPSGISALVNLEELDLCGHNGMNGEIPTGIGELSFLKTLDLSFTSISKIPITINMLRHLQTLKLLGCDAIQDLPELPSSLTSLVFTSKSLRSIPNLSNLTNLVKLQLQRQLSDDAWDLIPEGNLSWIGELSRLEKLDLQLLEVPAPPDLTSLSLLEELRLTHLDLTPLEQLPRNLLTLSLWKCEVKGVPLDGLQRLEKLDIGFCEPLQKLSIPSELRNLRGVNMADCPKLAEIQFEGLSESLQSLCVNRCSSLTRISGLSYLKNLKHLTIWVCSALADVEGLNELVSLKFLWVQECGSLRRLIDAFCTNIPHDCRVRIAGCQGWAKDFPPLRDYIDEILLNTSNQINHSFTIIFVLGAKKSSEGSAFVGGREKEKRNVTPDLVTYEGLIADVEGFSFRLERMWYKAPGEDCVLLIEIKSDQQAKGMVRLASKRGFVHLYVEGGFKSEPSDAECSEAMANSRQMRDGSAVLDGNVDGGTTRLEDQRGLSSSFQLKSASTKQGKRQRDDDHGSQSNTTTKNSTCGQQSGIPQHVIRRTRSQAAKIQPPVEVAVLQVEAVGPSRKKKRSDGKQVNPIRRSARLMNVSKCSTGDS